MAGPILICFGYGCCIIESVHEPLLGVQSKMSLPLFRLRTISLCRNEKRTTILTLDSIDNFLQAYASNFTVLHVDASNLTKSSL